MCKLSVNLILYPCCFANYWRTLKIITFRSYYYNTSGVANNYTDTSTQYYGSTGYSVQTYDGAYGGSAGAVSGPYGNTAY